MIHFLKKTAFSVIMSTITMALPILLLQMMNIVFDIDNQEVLELFACACFVAVTYSWFKFIAE